MTIEELYKWAVKNNCEKHDLCVYCNKENYDYSEEVFDVEIKKLAIHTEDSDPDNFDGLNFVEVKI